MKNSDLLDMAKRVPTAQHGLRAHCQTHWLLMMGGVYSLLFCLMNAPSHLATAGTFDLCARSMADEFLLSIRPSSQHHCCSVLAECAVRAPKHPNYSITFRYFDGAYCSLDKSLHTDCTRPFQGNQILISDQAILYPSTHRWESNRPQYAEANLIDQSETDIGREFFVIDPFGSANSTHQVIRLANIDRINGVLAFDLKDANLNGRRFDWIVRGSLDSCIERTSRYFHNLNYEMSGNNCVLFRRDMLERTCSAEPPQENPERFKKLGLCEQILALRKSRAPQ